jgi:hypothetical protein
VIIKYLPSTYYILLIDFSATFPSSLYSTLRFWTIPFSIKIIKLLSFSMYKPIDATVYDIYPIVVKLTAQIWKTYFVPTISLYNFRVHELCWSNWLFKSLKRSRHYCVLLSKIEFLTDCPNQQNIPLNTANGAIYAYSVEYFFHIPTLTSGSLKSCVPFF